MHLISVKLVRRGERMGRHESDQHSETSVDGLRKERERQREWSFVPCSLAFASFASISNREMPGGKYVHFLTFAADFK